MLRPCLGFLVFVGGHFGNFLQAGDGFEVDAAFRILAFGVHGPGFLAGQDGANLLTAYRRANNIVRAEMKKTPDLPLGEVSDGFLAEMEEKALAACLAEIGHARKGADDAAGFAKYLAALALMRQPVDAFFERVTVNADDGALRRNRLSLLAAVAGSMDRIADFSQIEG